MPFVTSFYNNNWRMPATEVDLVRWQFTATQITALQHLQGWYQNGGSDRAFVLYYWNFLKFLREQGKLAS